MALKQSLDLKLGQHLTLTPQLQQAIQLLQLSTLELQEKVQETFGIKVSISQINQTRADAGLSGRLSPEKSRI